MQPGDTFVSNRFVTILVGEFKPLPPQKIANVLFIGYGHVPFGEELNGRSLMIPFRLPDEKAVSHSIPTR